MNLKFLDIKSKDDLHETIAFLKKGFKWSREKSDLLETKFPSINKDIDTFGISIKHNNEIVGAVLLFHQGFLKIGDEKKSVINMSGWYVSKEFRGLPTISLLKHMLERNKKCIITNFSANNIASKILLGVGFRQMKLKRASLLLSDCIFSFSGIKVTDISKDNIKIDDNLETRLEDGVGISYLEVRLKNKLINLIVKRRVLKRSIFGIKLNWRTASILWSSDEIFVSKYWKKISLKLLLYTKSMKLICDFSSTFPKKAKERMSGYLFFSNTDKVDFLWPIQSEMNIFD